MIDDPVRKELFNRMLNEVCDSACPWREEHREEIRARIEDLIGTVERAREESSRWKYF